MSINRTVQHRDQFFDVTVPIGIADDTPRARRTDPIESHKAADRSARHRNATRLAILNIFRESDRMLTGKDVIALYHARGPSRGWPAIAFESPRKRTEELAKDGYLERLEGETAMNNRTEGVYVLTRAGLMYLLRQEAR